MHMLNAFALFPSAHGSWLVGVVDHDDILPNPLTFSRQQMTSHKY